VLLQRQDERFDDLAMSADTAAHMDVGLRIGLPLDPGETFQRALGIAVLEQWPGVAARGTLSQHIDWGIEPDGDRPLLQQGARPRIDKDPPARSNHSHLFIDEPCDQAPFAVAIIFLAVAFE